MAPKHLSGKPVDCDSFSDKSDTEYRVESENESDSCSEEKKANSKRRPATKVGKRKMNSSEHKITKKTSKSSFEWCKDDEITLLKKLSEFAGKNAAAYTTEFLNLVKNTLSKEVSMHQLSYKINCLKKEYLEKECQLKDNALRFSELHDQKMFKLSKRIWGSLKTSSNQSVAHNRNNIAGSLLIYFKNREIDVNCLKPPYKEHLKKEWEVLTLMYYEVLLKKRKFHLKIRELMYQMSNTKSVANQVNT